MASTTEPIPATSAARWALSAARSDGALPAGYRVGAAPGHTVIRWPAPVTPGGYDEIEILDDGHTFFRLDGKLHRLDGPAVVHVTSHHWFILGRKYRDRSSWYNAAVLALLDVPHLDEYLEAAIHADLTPAQAAAGYRHGVPVDELRADRALARLLHPPG